MTYEEQLLQDEVRRLAFITKCRNQIKKFPEQYVPIITEAFEKGILELGSEGCTHFIKDKNLVKFIDVVLKYCVQGPNPRKIK